MTQTRAFRATKDRQFSKWRIACLPRPKAVIIAWKIDHIFVLPGTGRGREGHGVWGANIDYRWKGWEAAELSIISLKTQNSRMHHRPVSLPPNPDRSISLCERARYFCPDRNTCLGKEYTHHLPPQNYTPEPDLSFKTNKNTAVVVAFLTRDEKHIN